MNLQQKELASARKAAELAGVSQEEIRRLKSQAWDRQAGLDEATTLRVQKQDLELELENSRVQLDEMTQTLQEWKRSSTALVGDSITPEALD
ncbi:hypothetical protein MY11210_009115 [Beauveria gryllotalpidicola]